MHSTEELIEAAIVAVLAGQAESARRSLRQIDFGRLAREREQAMAQVWEPHSKVKRPPLAQKTPRAPVRKADMLATFRRDHFTCRYAHCQRRTIYLPVLKALSRLFPDELPYQSNWRPVQDHILYWTWSTSLEHRVSFPMGGNSEPANLITTCYQCNDVKNYLPLENLGWTVAEPAKSDWNGLIEYLVQLDQLILDGANQG